MMFLLHELLLPRGRVRRWCYKRRTFPPLYRFLLTQRRLYTCLVTVTPDFVKVGKTRFGDIAVSRISVVKIEPVPSALGAEPEVL